MYIYIYIYVCVIFAHTLGCSGYRMMFHIYQPSSFVAHSMLGLLLFMNYFTSRDFSWVNYGKPLSLLLLHLTTTVDQLASEHRKTLPQKLRFPQLLITPRASRILDIYVSGGFSVTFRF